MSDRQVFSEINDKHVRSAEIDIAAQFLAIGEKIPFPLTDTEKGIALWLAANIYCTTCS